MLKPAFDNDIINKYMNKNSIPLTNLSCYASNNYSNNQHDDHYPTPYDTVYGQQFNYIDPQQYKRPEHTFWDKVNISTGINYFEEVLKVIIPSKITENNPLTLLNSAIDIVESKDKIRESLKQGAYFLTNSFILTISLNPYTFPISIMMFVNDLQL